MVGKSTAWKVGGERFLKVICKDREKIEKMRPGRNWWVGTCVEGERGVPQHGHVDCVHRTPPTLRPALVSHQLFCQLHLQENKGLATVIHTP